MVLALPHFTHEPTNLTAWEGDVISIPCDANGLPKPITFWIIEGNHDSLFFSGCVSKSNMLRFDNAKPKDSGRFICTAVNSAGSSLQTSYLKVFIFILNIYYLCI